MKASVALIYAAIAILALGAAAVCGSIMRADATLMKVNKPELCAKPGQAALAQASRKPPPSSLIRP